MPVETPVAPVTTPPDFDATFPDEGLDAPSSAPTPPVPDEQNEPETPTPEQPKEPNEPADKTAEKPKETAGAEKSKEPDFEPPKVAKPSELRTWANKMGTRAKTAEAELSKMRERIKALETAKPKTENTAALAEELATTKKRLEEYEGEMRLTKYERSGEYKDKYEKPYREAVQQAYNDVQEFIAYIRDPNDPEAVTERQATKDDFNEVYHLPTGQAFKRAKELFGDAAMAVIGHRQKIRELARKASAAIDEHKAKAGEWETQTKAQQEQQAAAALQMFEVARRAHGEKYKDIFSQRDGDAEGNELLTKGEQVAQRLFSGGEGLTQQQVAMRDAQAYNWIAAHPRLVRDLAKTKAELTALKQTVDKLRGSGPGKIEGGKEPLKGSDDGWEAEFDKKVTG